MTGEPAAIHGNDPSNTPPVSRGALVTVVIVVLLVAACLAVFGIFSRRHADAKLADYTAATSAPPVSLATPTFEKSASEIVLPGNMQPFSQAPIYARTAGYVKAWYKDIGAHVKKGDVLAVIETPELDQQLSQAKADLATAQSNAAIAKTTADRYQGLIAQNAVSQQDTDNAVAAYQARKTEVSSAEANVKRVTELQSFERITAPFDGVVTARNLDIGQLITASGATTSPGAGSVSNNKEIFDVAAINTLRVFVNVPQVNAPDAKVGVVATLTLPQYPGRTFQGKLVRTSDAVDPATRTLLAEIDVDNRTGELLPGSYTQVHLNVSRPQASLIVPISAIILHADGVNVATVDSSNHAHIVRVVPGRDFGASMEILNGLEADQKIIANPPDSLTEGEQVRVVTPGQNKNQPAEAQ